MWTGVITPNGRFIFEGDILSTAPHDDATYLYTIIDGMVYSTIYLSDDIVATGLRAEFILNYIKNGVFDVHSAGGWKYNRMARFIKEVRRRRCGQE